MSPGGAADGRSHVVIRRLGPDDWRVSRRVRLAALAEAPYAFMSTLDREQGFGEQFWRDRLASATAATFLAWVDGEPAGTATGKIDNPGDEYAIPDAWQLVGMWVDPAARGSGVADLLVDTVANHVRAAGARALVLWVTDVNDRAQAFYRRMGFVPTGARQPVRQDEPDHTEQQMIRHLG